MMVTYVNVFLDQCDFLKVERDDKNRTQVITTLTGKDVPAVIIITRSSTSC